MKAPGIRICLILFLTFVFLNAGIISGFAAPDNENSTASESGDYIVYYFHTDYRCSSCKRIEEWSQAAVESEFSKALEKGNLQWQVRNVDREEHKHFVEDFNLHTKSLVIVKQADGEPVRWNNLDKVWQLLRNKEKFTSYVQSEIKAFMEKN